MKCQKCGSEIDDDSLFCSKCGAKVESVVEEKFKCPKCGSEVTKDSKFCRKCGNELIWDNVDYNHIPVPVKAEEETAPAAQTVQTVQAAPRKRADVNKIFGFISLGLISLAVLLLFIGWFGDTLSLNGSALLRSYAGDSSSARLDITWFFGRSFDSVKSLKEYEGQGAYVFALIFTILNTLTYVIMLVGILAFGTLAILNAVKKVQGKEVKSTYIGGLIATTLPHIVYTSMLYSTAMSVTGSGRSESINIGLGWGSILVIGALIYLFAASVLELFAKESKGFNKKRLVSSITYTVSLITGLVMLLCLSGSILSMTEKMSSNSSMTAASTPYAFTLSTITQMCSDTTTEVPYLYLPILSFFFHILAIIIAVPTFSGLVKKNDSANIVGFACGIFFFIASVIFGIIGMNQSIDPSQREAVSCGVGPAAIAAIVFAVMTFALIAVSLSFKKKSEQIA